MQKIGKKKHNMQKKIYSNTFHLPPWGLELLYRIDADIDNRQKTL